jgi:protease IV
VREAIEHTYGMFLDRIAEGRNMKRNRIAKVAEGRIMGGSDAKQAGLVDEIGGLGRAIDLAIELAKADPDIVIQMVRAPSGLAALLNDTPQSHAALVAELRRQAQREALYAVGGALLPYRSEIETYGASMAPLLSGEHVVVALPYALAIR